MTLEEKFRAYHAQHPTVYNLVRMYAFEIIHRGYKHYSMAGLIHRVRWHTDIQARDENAPFKINSGYSAFYVRLFELKNPNYTNYFRKRRSVADNADLSDLI